MQQNIVITGVGRDKVGIVARLSNFLFKKGLNLLDSSMTRLRGEFALILMAELPNELTLEDLSKELSELGIELDLTISFRELDQVELIEPDLEANSNSSFIVTVYGADSPGIVANVTKILADRNYNITDVQTKKTTRDSQEIFVMILEVTNSSEVNEEELKELLSINCNNFTLDISVQKIEYMEL